ncbi:hypothetical protein NX059_005036 [Plenodomus lindquistii]|nr:hypothetical protein NX059_005036 [Plenodomus lindquistii]
MEPLSITASVLSVTTTFVTSAVYLNEIRNAWKLAPVTVGTLCSQIKVSAASLSQIQSLLLSEKDALSDKPELVASFDTTLTSCLVLSSLLEKYVSKIKGPVLGGSASTWKAKFRTLWNETEIKELLRQLDTQQTGITMLISLLGMDSWSEIKRTLKRNEEILKMIERNTRQTRRSYPISARASIFSADEDSLSIISKLAEFDGTGDHSTEQSFESVVLKSNEYSRAYDNILGSEHTNGSDDARTIVDRTPITLEDILHTSERRSRATRPKIPVRTFKPFSNDYKISIKALNVREVYAWTICRHTSSDAGTLNFEYWTKINKIRKVNAEWYWGEFQAKATEKSATKGLFKRSQILIVAELSEPLQVCTTQTAHFDIGSPDYLEYSAKQTFEVTRLDLDLTWYAREQTLAWKTTEEEKLIYLCDLELDDRTRKHIDSPGSLLLSPCST